MEIKTLKNFSRKMRNENTICQSLKTIILKVQFVAINAYIKNVEGIVRHLALSER